MAVGIVALLLAVTLPTYRTYLRRSKTIEAVLNVRRLYDGSVAYFEAPHFDGYGAPLPRQFPSTQLITPTPVGVCCVQQPPICNPSTYAGSWNDPVWQALGFSVADPFYYSYQYDSAGLGENSLFTATAMGDLTCDGARFSLFQRVGHVLHSRVVSPIGLYHVNDLE